MPSFAAAIVAQEERWAAEVSAIGLNGSPPSPPPVTPTMLTVEMASNVARAGSLLAEQTRRFRGLQLDCFE